MTISLLGRSRRARPQVEPLEDRSLPSVQVLATLGQPAPGPGAAGFLINDFEPNGLNNKGQVLFGADLGTAADPASFIGEAIYLGDNKGHMTRLAGATDSAPGGGTYDSSLFYGPSALNDQGDVAFTFQLSPLMLPFGVNGGTYRYSHNTQTVTPVVVPFVTPAPGGGTFQGTVFSPVINNRGDLLFDGIVATDKGVHIPNQTYIGLGQGIFKQDGSGKISSVVAPGDAAPEGGTFDFAGGPWVNDRGDIAFNGHVAGDPASIPGAPPESVVISAINNVYLRDEATGTITTIAHAGDPAPGGGAFTATFGPEINNSGDVAFLGQLSADFTTAGLFRYSKGVLTSIARPGDAMPGGGHLVTVSQIEGNQMHINNRGDIVFTASLDTNTAGFPDTGLYQWSAGRLTVVARTGTVLPGVGTIESLTSPSNIVVPPPTVFSPTGGSINNDLGQVLFGATLTGGRTVLLLETRSGTSQSPARAPVTPASVTGLPGGGHTVSTTTPPAVANLSGLAVSLVLGAPSAARIGEAISPASGRANATPAARDDSSAVAIPPQITTSPVLASSAVTHRSQHRAVDDFFATLAEGLLDDPLARAVSKATGD
jgi:hypothetical protein